MSYSICDVSRETIAAVETAYLANKDQFADLVEKWLWWNRSVNLFSKKTTASDLHTHIVHSLFLHFWLRDSDKIVLDAGTGGGLPGLPLAIVNPSKSVYLADTVYKKFLALNNTVKFLGVSNAFPVNQDVFEYNSISPDVVVSKHAFSITDLLKIATKSRCSHLLTLKGSDVLDQLADLDTPFASLEIIKISWNDDPFFHSKYLVDIRLK